ncbi:unnamed protein product [Phytophthora lilii]|uniref:Unnamed protein product n=1 Tax=Phytophthora lilii TaxID=2077276 RepID=A0A9W6WNB1_9STRA|nr:unnamed protein product [Phytophthora lilii]
MSLTLTFDKHKSKTIEEVNSSDPSYCRWLSHQNRFTALEMTLLLNSFTSNSEMTMVRLCLTWGKYKNRTIKQIQTIDLNYLAWLSKNDFVKSKCPKLKAEVDVLLS